MKEIPLRLQFPTIAISLHSGSLPKTDSLPPIFDIWDRKVISLKRGAVAKCLGRRQQSCIKPWANINQLRRNTKDQLAESPQKAPKPLIDPVNSMPVLRNLAMHLLLIANIVTTSKAPVTTSDALVPSSFLLLLVRHLLLLAMHFLLVASKKPSGTRGAIDSDHHCHCPFVWDAERIWPVLWSRCSAEETCSFFWDGNTSTSLQIENARSSCVLCQNILP